MKNALYYSFKLLPLLLLCFLILTSCNDNPQSTTTNNKAYEDIDTMVASIKEDFEIVGLNYAILINGKLVHKNTMGIANIEQQVPMTIDKLFAVASISKLFSSTALHVLLKSKGRNVNETVGDFLPDQNLPESWKKLTLKQLLSHTSGIPDQIDYQIYLAPESDDFVIKQLYDKPFSSEPGEKNKYNATGFLLIRMIIEELSGQNFEVHMQEKYFNEFNLTKANYAGFKQIVSDRVTSYRKVEERFELFPLSYAPPMYAAAGLNIDIGELTVWFQEVLNESMLSQSELIDIWTPVKLNNGKNGAFGLGWDTYSLKKGWFATGHGGAGISSLRHYWNAKSSKTVTVILLTNGASNWIEMPDDINLKIAMRVLPEISE
ncbi:serine hydrolase domain-containing protein [Aquimarina algicola]|uniref:Beta-lactamase family protein n=1 Tax=Aquimarina algicola TaxID=2589995 RepID=A0A504J8U8_9FLAO|nr:serine hydrolase domain-containing protein [Aquimarina algicola]TPN83469.1 beta-lactamase family protein [Aquimarina algicola]